MTTDASPASFLLDPPVDQAVRKLYDADQHGMGYVANLSRVWAQSPEALEILSNELMLADRLSGLDPDERSLVVLATASTMGDAYCSLAYGPRVAQALGEEGAVGVLQGDDTALTVRGRALAAWARSVVRDPSGSTPEQVQALRDAGFDDRQIFGLTLFVALRMLFSTVNDALGARPDAALASAAPPAILDAVDFGRPPMTR